MAFVLNLGVCYAQENLSAVKESNGSPSEVTNSSKDDWDRSYHEISYSAISFEEPKLTGFYSYGFTILPSKIAKDFYGGIHLGMIGLNAGLVDSDFMVYQIKVGPAFGYYFTKNAFVTMPIDVVCNVNMDDKASKKTAWGMQVSPAFYYGKKRGVFVGPMWTVSFTGGGSDLGFRAGFFF